MVKTFKAFSKLWCFAEETLSDKFGKHFEGAFTQGSGYIHLRGSYEEGLACAPQNEEYMRMPANVTVEKPRHPRSKYGVYIPGITGLHPLLREEIVNLPYLAKLSASLNGVQLDMDTCEIFNYRRVLDLRDAVLYRSFNWKVKDAEICCEYRRFVSRAQQNLIVIEADYKAKTDCTLLLCSCIDTQVRTNGYNHFEKVNHVTSDNVCGAEIITDTGDGVLMAALMCVDGRDIFLENNCQTYVIELKAGQTLQVCKYSVAATTRDKEKMSFKELCKRLKAAACNANLYNEHAAVWEEMWKKSAVEISGDDNAQRAVNFSVYHLLRSANPNDSRTAVCAKGYAGEAYFGHYFWDTEIYLMPFFLYTEPETARSLMRFRMITLEGAKRNAKAYGYKGAKYAWESSVTGDEQCPNWQYCDNEIHINADVVFGLWHYYCATKDSVFLRESLSVFVETTRYWISRVSYGKNGDVSLNGVMGPDEYICFCKNNTYTNSMVKEALKCTLEALELCNLNVADTFSMEELSKINLIIEKLPILRDGKGVPQQCEGFDDFDELDFSEIWPDKSKPFGAVVSQERNYRSKALKQADTLMLPYLFPKRFQDKEIHLIYNKYEPFTTHDSSLSYIVHAIVKARLGDATEGCRMFERSLAIDTAGGAAEGIHIANCGGIWQGIVFGFAGLCPSYEASNISEPVFSPHLPAHWNGLKFQLVYGGKRYFVTITHNGYEAKPC